MRTLRQEPLDREAPFVLPKSPIGSRQRERVVEFVSALVNQYKRSAG